MSVVAPSRWPGLGLAVRVCTVGQRAVSVVAPSRWPGLGLAVRVCTVMVVVAGVVWLWAGPVGAQTVSDLVCDAPVSADDTVDCDVSVALGGVVTRVVCVWDVGGTSPGDEHEQDFGSPADPQRCTFAGAGQGVLVAVDVQTWAGRVERPLVSRELTTSTFADDDGGGDWATVESISDAADDIVAAVGALSGDVQDVHQLLNGRIPARWDSETHWTRSESLLVAVVALQTATLVLWLLRGWRRQPRSR